MRMSYYNTILQHIICMCIKEHPHCTFFDISYKVHMEASKNGIKCTDKNIKEILLFLLDTKSIKQDKGEYKWIKN